MESYVGRVKNIVSWQGFTGLVTFRKANFSL